MGHDIWAKDENGEDVAYNRRAAGSCKNRVLYLALDSEEFYGGCSGICDSREFTRQEIEEALARLQNVPLDWLERPENMADQLVRVFEEAGVKVVNMASPSSEVEQEKQFLMDCLKYLVGGAEKVRVLFA